MSTEVARHLAYATSMSFFLATTEVIQWSGQGARLPGLQSWLSACLAVTVGEGGLAGSGLGEAHEPPKV